MYGAFLNKDCYAAVAVHHLLLGFPGNWQELLNVARQRLKLHLVQCGVQILIKYYPTISIPSSGKFSAERKQFRRSSYVASAVQA